MIKAVASLWNEYVYLDNSSTDIVDVEIVMNKAFAASCMAEYKALRSIDLGYS